jgi:hypothetical protein
VGEGDDLELGKATKTLLLIEIVGWGIVAVISELIRLLRDTFDQPSRIAQEVYLRLFIMHFRSPPSCERSRFARQRPI